MTKRASHPPPLPPRLATRRLVLRAPVAADAGAIFAGYAQDVALTRWMKWRAHDVVATTIAFVDGCITDFAAGTRLAYVIAHVARPDVPIGMLEARPLRHSVELGYVLARAEWGHGLMPEAVSALTAVALDDERCFRVQAFCDVDNHASQRTLEKAGFVREGRHERFIVHPNVDDEPRACFMYARCR